MNNRIGLIVTRKLKCLQCIFVTKRIEPFDYKSYLDCPHCTVPRSKKLLGLVIPRNKWNNEFDSLLESNLGPLSYNSFSLTTRPPAQQLPTIPAVLTNIDCANFGSSCASLRLHFLQLPFDRLMVARLITQHFFAMLSYLRTWFPSLSIYLPIPYSTSIYLYLYLSIYLHPFLFYSTSVYTSFLLTSHLSIHTSFYLSSYWSGYCRIIRTSFNILTIVNVPKLKYMCLFTSTYRCLIFR